MSLLDIYQRKAWRPEIINIYAILRLTITERQNISMVIQQDAGLLLRLGIWGRESGQLNEFQTGVILTVATYAGGGWVKIPSHKQAKHVVAALQIAQEAGFTNSEDSESA